MVTVGIDGGCAGAGSDAMALRLGVLGHRYCYAAAIVAETSRTDSSTKSKAKVTKTKYIKTNLSKKASKQSRHIGRLASRQLGRLAGRQGIGKRTIHILLKTNIRQFRYSYFIDARVLPTLQMIDTSC